jgi:hypothetical protein
MKLDKTGPMFCYARDDAFAPGAPLSDDPCAHPDAYPILRLWKEFGVSARLLLSDWNELRQVCVGLPDELPLINPPLDKQAARQAMDRYLRQRGWRAGRVRWFEDVRSAIAYDSSLATRARPAFPAIDFCPRAITQAWIVVATKAQMNAVWAASQIQTFEAWRTAAKPATHSPDESEESEIDWQIRCLPTLLEMFAAGVFYYSIRPAETVLVARPSLWMEKGQLHRPDGPAVEWATGERHYFWRNNDVPRWVIENPERITPERIRKVRNSAQRRCMVERYGMQRFTILERWLEWRKCRSRRDFEPFVACGLPHAFRAVSERITGYAEAVVARLTPAGLRNPRIEKGTVAAALDQFLIEWGEQPRQLRWFDSARAARGYIRGRGSQHLRAAYWPRLRIAPLLDTLSYRGDLSWHSWTDEDWQDWTIAAPPTLECDDPRLMVRRSGHIRMWQEAISSFREERSPRVQVSVSLADPAVRRWTPLIDAFAAGLFCYWLGAEEIVCVPRPVLWIDNDRLHREDGPAVEWPGERHYFYHGVQVPTWLFEHPERITPNTIRVETNVEIRRCMLERFGFGRFLREAAGKLVAEDGYGRLWHADFDARGQMGFETILEVRNGTRERDGTYRQYFLSVPPHMRSPRAAVAWTYGLAGEQYELAVRT